MNKVKHYIKQATSERVRSRGLIRAVATEAARIQREETRRNQSRCINRCVRQRIAKDAQVGYINRKPDQADAMAIAHELNFLLTGWIGLSCYVYNQAYSMRISSCV